MNMNLKFERQIPIAGEYDVIVAGGGPSGCTAAAAAAREGAITLIIEATGCLGGMGTSGLVPAWCPFSDKEKIIYRGLAERVFNESKKPMKHVNPNALDWVPIDAEHLKIVYDDLLTEFGADILFHTFISAVDKDGDGNITELIVSNKKGLSGYKAKMFIDCTGDADVAVFAGADYMVRDEVQPATHCFILGGVDNYHAAQDGMLHPGNKNSPIYQISASDKYPLVQDNHVCDTLVGSNTYGFNAGHIWDVDSTDPVSVSKSMIKGRKLARQLRDAFAEYRPAAFGGSYVVSTANLMGIRESRRIVGEYEFTAEDYFGRRSFEDEIARNCYYIDIHFAKKEIENDKTKINNDDKYKHYDKGESHGIPYRCLIPKKLNNLLVAGRSICCDDITQGSLRVMPTCLVTGEAAGVAAGIAIREGLTDTRKVDTKKLREKLLVYGAYIK